ncbi:DUF1310 family protein [Streptococcus iniae]|uniref:DUF1310 family protein n=2 Tax=Streptococcus iniae TaxID=1346 RepID=A0A3L8GRY3_STRIN|nr:DUF1310 family protein [Streptococcus iniae]AGM98000.1 hypothetical protein K710_0195 [Streptococcus iniae SF1]AHY15076.1 hypothetical protein DQ08_00940 [Streptococcus iniae]AHY16947.1 hypothetical protein DW64_00935 [Streptococcus iniae]AJG25233.1 hypothetical protein SI82_01035 [Streptococcus iniae]APD31137.1 hypothetical protein BMF34_01115 [Streptococcus iniae]
MNVKKIIYILLGLLIAVGIVIGRHQLQAKREYDQMVEIVESKEVKHLIEDDLKYFDKNALSNKGRVKEYSIDKKSIKKNPMGGIMVNIYINNNKKYKLSYTLVHELTGKGIDIGGRGISKDLNVLLKEN